MPDSAIKWFILSLLTCICGAVEAVDFLPEPCARTFDVILSHEESNVLRKVDPEREWTEIFEEIRYAAAMDVDEDEMRASPIARNFHFTLYKRIITAPHPLEHSFVRRFKNLRENSEVDHLFGNFLYLESLMSLRYHLIADEPIAMHMFDAFDVTMEEIEEATYVDWFRSRIVYKFTRWGYIYPDVIERQFSPLDDLPDAIFRQDGVLLQISSRWAADPDAPLHKVSLLRLKKFLRAYPDERKDFPELLDDMMPFVFRGLAAYLRHPKRDRREAEEIARLFTNAEVEPLDYFQ